jgi:hypothetical protein
MVPCGGGVRPWRSWSSSPATSARRRPGRPACLPDQTPRGRSTHPTHRRETPRGGVSWSAARFDRAQTVGRSREPGSSGGRPILAATTTTGIAQSNGAMPRGATATKPTLPVDTPDARRTFTFAWLPRGTGPSSRSSIPPRATGRLRWTSFSSLSDRVGLWAGPPRRTGSVRVRPAATRNSLVRL